MIRCEKICKKTVAISLVFFLIFANCFTLLSNFSYAKSDDLGKQLSVNTSNNVEYTVNFAEEDEELEYEYIGAIDEENLSIHAQVEVKKEGYLKNAKILIESEKGLSFEIAEESNEDYQTEGNQVTVSNISAGEKRDIVLPIKYKEREDIENLNKKINVRLIGTYVNGKGEEKTISENYILRLIWNTNSEYNVSSDIRKYIPFAANEEKGIVLQTVVRTFIPEQNNFVAKEEIVIDAAKIDGYEIKKIIVSNKSGENLEEKDWNYDEKENTVSIKVENKEEKISSEEYLVTYVLSGDKELELPFKINKKVNGYIFMYGTDEKIEASYEEETKIEEAMGNVVTIESTSTDKIALGNILNNSLAEENEYKTNYSTKVTADISSTEMIEAIVIKNLEEEFENDEGTYTLNSSTKSVEIDKNNFEEVLGTDGKIEIIDQNNEIVSTINKDTKLNEEKYKAELDLDKYTIRTSKPISEGILTITINKEIIKTDYSYEQLKTFSHINTKYVGSVIYEGDSENKVSDMTNKIELVKPETNAELSISNNIFSTIADNEAEIEIKLNNTTEDIDMYKNPKFEITFPEYIDDVIVSNIAIANAEDVFTIKESTIYKNEEGKIVLTIDTEGEQTRYNLNTINNGTSILINCKIKLNLYTPSSNQKIRLAYSNENVTSYRQENNGKGYSELEVAYKAPFGVVSINRTSGYESTGKAVTSVHQGKVTDKIEIFADSKVATMDIIVMNNNENSCDNVKILGRIPFKGNKDVVTGEDLGTTLDTRIVSEIKQANTNLANATIYYSSNGEATEDLEDINNGWKTEIQDLRTIKSYLIVLNDYDMKPGEIIKYSYDYEIPANLEHNTNIYGSFKTIFDNKNNVATVKEISKADIVGLTTGAGPQLAVETNTNVKERVKEYEKIKYTIKVENTGSEVSENVVVKTKLPEEATLAVNSTVTTVEGVAGWTLKPEREIITNIPKLNPGEIKIIEFFVQVNKLPTIEEYYARQEGFSRTEDGKYAIQEAYIDENGETKYKEKIIENLPEIRLVCQSVITAKDLAKEIKTSDSGILIERSKLIAEETIETQDDTARVNETIESKILIKNNTDETMRNIVVTKRLPEGLKYGESYTRGYAEDGITLNKINNTDYNMDTRTVTWRIDELNPRRTVLLIGDWVVSDLKDNTYKDIVSTETMIDVNGDTYQAGQVDIPVGIPNLEVTQNSNKTNEYVKVGDQIEYTFTIENTGAVRANNVTLSDMLPEELSIKSLTYTVDGIEVSKVVAKNEDATVYTSIMPEGKLEAKVLAEVNDIGTAQKTIKNVGAIKGASLKEVKSNEITNIIERTEDVTGKASLDNEPNTPIIENSQSIFKEINNTNNAIKERYEIKGNVWLDENKDGIRDEKESKLPKIEVKLFNLDSNEALETTFTDQDGQYKFANRENGKYILKFYYDNTKYGITEYKKQNIEEDKNSDIIKLEEDNRIIATTDVIEINNGSISNIDAGLVMATTFDLSLRKSISKVTVQTSEGIKNYDFNNTDLAKVDINGKHLNGATVLVEYTFTVKNEGELEGYAKQIVDYMPSELEFSTELNKNWYKGNDGNLYTEELADSVIAPGEIKTVKLVLSKAMNETNTGITNNQAEISKDYNKAGIADIDSVPGNKKDDDMSAADLIIGVKTGDTLIFISAIIAGIVAAIVIIVAIKSSKIIYKARLKFRKEV